MKQSKSLPCTFGPEAEWKPALVSRPVGLEGGASRLPSSHLAVDEVHIPIEDLERRRRPDYFGPLDFVQV